MRIRQVATAAVAAALIAIPLEAPPAQADDANFGLIVTPVDITIEGIAPGVTKSAQVMVTNASSSGMSLTVNGALHAGNDALEADLLHVTTAGCSESWFDILGTPSCLGTSVEQDPIGDLLTIALPPGLSTHLLISAGLGPDAGQGAMGQTWTATFTVTAQQQTVAQTRTKPRQTDATAATPSAEPSSLPSPPPGYTRPDSDTTVTPGPDPAVQRELPKFVAVVAAAVILLVSAWIVLARNRRQPKDHAINETETER